MVRSIRSHIRHNAVAYVALFFALGGTSAYAANTVFSDDIVDGEVKAQDLGPSSVRTGKIADGHVRTADVLDNDLTRDDLGPSSVGAFELSQLAFDAADIRDVLSGFPKKFGLADNVVQSEEIEDKSIRDQDLAASAEPTAFSTSIANTGIICNNGCAEGSLTLPAGSYAISAKITVRQQPNNGDLLHVVCDLDVGGNNDADKAFVRQLGDDAFASGSAAGATLPLQAVQDLPSGGKASLNCADQDVGDATGADLKITALEVGLTP